VNRTGLFLLLSSVVAGSLSIASGATGEPTLSTNLTIRLEGFAGNHELRLLVAHDGASNRSLVFDPAGTAVALEKGNSTLSIMDGQDPVAIRRVTATPNGTASTLHIQPNIPYLASIDSPVCPFARGGQAEITLHAGNVVVGPEVQLVVHAVGKWPGSTLNQTVTLSKINGTNQVRVPLSGGAAPSGNVEFTWQSMWHGKQVASGSLTSASCPFADCPAGTQAFSLGAPVADALGTTPFCIPSQAHPAYANLRSLLQALNATASAAIQDIKTSNNGTVAETAWRNYNRTARSPHGPLETIRKQIEAFQMDGSPLPTWEQLAKVKGAAARMDADVDRAFRDTAEMRFDAAESSLQEVRWQLALGIGFAAALGAMTAVSVTWVWGSRWKRKVARWIGYNAGFRALDATKLSVMGSVVTLLVGAAIALPLGLMRLLQVMLR
jgi:hypothetical protein